jgi:translation initiation factor 1
MKSRRPDGVVYSTRKAEDPPAPAPREQGGNTSFPAGLSARVQREKAHRAGRLVTVVYDLELSLAQLVLLCARLKRSCATGGTVKQGRLEIQGDHAEKILADLISLGIRARRSGA